MSAVLKIIKQITIEGYYTSIMFEFQSMDRLGKGVVRKLGGAQSKTTGECDVGALPSVSPYNTVLGPPPSITIVVSCISDDERGRYRGPGVSWGRNGLENNYFLVHIPQLRTNK